MRPIEYFPLSIKKKKIIKFGRFYRGIVMECVFVDKMALGPGALNNFVLILSSVITGMRKPRSLLHFQNT